MCPRFRKGKIRITPIYNVILNYFFSAAHGLCAILQMLISVPGYIDSLGDCQARDDIKNSIGMCNNMVKITFLKRDF